MPPRPMTPRPPSRRMPPLRRRPRKPADPLALLKQDLDDTKDKLLRALAETENVRRRAQKDREDMSEIRDHEFRARRP